MNYCQQTINKSLNFSVERTTHSIKFTEINSNNSQHYKLSKVGPLEQMQHYSLLGIIGLAKEVQAVVSISLPTILEVQVL